jgi:hypothetical protein
MRLTSCDIPGNVALQTAWHDHRQDLTESFFEAREAAKAFLRVHPELLFSRKYSAVVVPCARCEDYGPFRRAEPAAILRSLGYW